MRVSTNNQTIRRLTIEEIVDEIAKPQEYAAVPSGVWREVLTECVREALAEEATAVEDPTTMTLRQVARIEGVTPERCRQIELKAIQKCQRYMRRNRTNVRDLLFERDVPTHRGNRRTR